MYTLAVYNKPLEISVEYVVGTLTIYKFICKTTLALFMINPDQTGSNPDLFI